MATHCGAVGVLVLELSRPSAPGRPGADTEITFPLVERRLRTRGLRLCFRLHAQYSGCGVDRRSIGPPRVRDGRDCVLVRLQRCNRLGRGAAGTPALSGRPRPQRIGDHSCFRQGERDLPGAQGNGAR